MGSEPFFTFLRFFPIFSDFLLKMGNMAILAILGKIGIFRQPLIWAPDILTLARSGFQGDVDISCFPIYGHFGRNAHKWQKWHKCDLCHFYYFQQKRDFYVF